MSRSIVTAVVAATGASGVLACVGGGVPSGLDGGFADAPVVAVPPTQVFDETGDLGLVIAVRVVPPPSEGADLVELELVAYDDTTGEQAWVDRMELAPGLASVEDVGQIDPRDGRIEMELTGRRGRTRLDYDARTQTWAYGPDRDLVPLFDELDFGAFHVMRQDLTASEEDERRIPPPLFEPFSYTPGFLRPLIGPRTSVSRLYRGPGSTLMLDALRYGPPEVRERNGMLEHFERRLDGVLDVFLVEVATGAVVGVGERRPPAGTTPLYVGPRIQQHRAVDRAGRVYYRDDAQVSADPIQRAGIDGGVDAITLDWGEHAECLDTRIFAVGPEGHLLTRERPDDRFPSGPPDGGVCLFAPDGSLVLSLPADPDRAWIGFSDPIQWYGP